MKLINFSFEILNYIIFSLELISITFFVSRNGKINLVKTFIFRSTHDTRLESSQEHAHLDIYMSSIVFGFQSAAVKNKMEKNFTLFIHNFMKETENKQTEAVEKKFSEIKNSRFCVVQSALCAIRLPRSNATTTIMRQSKPRQRPSIRSGCTFLCFSQSLLFPFHSTIEKCNSKKNCN